MPYKEWAVGEEVLASDFNPSIAKQVVAVFDNAAARTAAMANPTSGQLSYLKSAHGRIDYWNGNQWIPCQGTGQHSGNTVVTTNASGQATITWVTPLWPGGPGGGTDYVAHLTNGDTSQGLVYFGVVSLNPTSITVQGALPGGASANNKVVRLLWTVGPYTAHP